MNAEPQLLIVDDNDTARETLEAVLTGQGYQLAFASSGAQALAEAAKLIPDLILLDVMMPGMDGFEVCQQLRADPRLAEVPVIMVTALDDHESRVRGIEAGADDFLAKPFDRAELRARVRTITKLNRFRRLHQERAKFEWVVQESDDGYLIIDDQSNILYANSQARLYLGIPPNKNAPIAGTFVELAQKQYHLEPQEAWVATPASFLRYLVRPESLTANAFWLQVEIVQVPTGPDAGQMIRMRDVTDQVNARREKRTFATLVNHKMRTPLTSAVGSIEYLAQYAPEMAAEEIAGSVQLAFKGIKRLEGAVEDVLSYLEIPNQEQASERFALWQLQAVVAEASSNLEIQRLMVSCPEELFGSRLSLSNQAMEMILGEILENAKKFHPRQNPTVEVQAARSAPREIVLRVRDDGLTLSPEQLAQAWLPFYQGEKYFTGQVAGMGLGLSLVASLVWSASGTCRMVNREEGPGVVVELVLPLAD